MVMEYTEIAKSFTLARISYIFSTV